MNEYRLMDAIGQLPEDLLVPVERLRSRRPRAWVPVAAAVACLCLLLSLPIGMGASTKNDAMLEMENAPAEAPGYQYSADQSLADAETAGSRFLAIVIRVEGDSILVEPLEDAWERRSADRIEVSLGYVEDPPRLAPGDLVRITYSGTLLESYPAVAVDVTGVSRLN